MGRKSREKWERRRGKLLPISGPQKDEDSLDDFLRDSQRADSAHVWMDSREPGDSPQEINVVIPQEDVISSEIENLLELIRPIDRLELIAAVCNELCWMPESKLSSEVLDFSLAEYVISLSLVDPFPKEPVCVGADDVEKIIEAARGVLRKAMLFHGLANRGSSGFDALQRAMQLYTIRVRGEAYPQHAEDLAMRLTWATSGFFAERFGLKPEEIWALLRKIRAAVHAKMNAPALFTARLDREMRRFDEWLRRQPRRLRADREQAALIYHRKRGSQVSDLMAFLTPNLLDRGAGIYAYSPESEQEFRFLDQLSAQFGENRTFAQPARWRCWPLNDSVVEDYPFIRHDGTFYAFMLGKLMSEAPHMLERLVRRLDADYHKTAFLKARDRVTEERACELVAGVLRPTLMATRVYYPSPEDPAATCEADGLFILDQAIVVLEAKAGGLSKAARRGAPSLRDAVTELVGKAFSQAVRLFRYIDAQPEATFYDHDGKEILRVVGKDYPIRYAISVTHEPLRVLGLSLPALRGAGLLPGGTWPWAVYLCDLQSVAEILGTSVEFLHYLNRRLNANRPGLKAVDELDLLGYYIDRGLFFPEGALGGNHKMLLIGHMSEKIDKYYYGRALGAGSQQKPRQYLPERMSALLDSLERLRPSGYLIAAFTLLDLSGRGRDHVERSLKQIASRCASDGKEHSFTFNVQESNTVMLMGQFNCLPSLQVWEWWTTRWLAAGYERLILLAWTGTLSAPKSILVRVMDKGAFAV